MKFDGPTVENECALDRLDRCTIRTGKMANLDVLIFPEIL
jgi:hypothetical protein